MVELAQLQDGQLVYGLYEEIEKYADKEDTCVEHYFDHVAPFVVQKNFKYVIDKAGLDWSHGKTIIGNSEWHDELEDNRLSMYESDLWGVPSFRLHRGDKLLNLGWGQDRLWVIGDRMLKNLTGDLG